MAADSLLAYFNRELEALRGLAGEFAERHPKIAGRLRLTKDTVDDPHVGRLLEGVAFLGARVQHRLDDEFPELTDGLLSVLYPHYLAPCPRWRSPGLRPTRNAGPRPSAGRPRDRNGSGRRRDVPVSHGLSLDALAGGDRRGPAVGHAAAGASESGRHGSRFLPAHQLALRQSRHDVHPARLGPAALLPGRRTGLGAVGTVAGPYRSRSPLPTIRRTHSR